MLCDDPVDTLLLMYTFFIRGNNVLVYLRPLTNISLRNVIQGRLLRNQPS